MKKLYFGSNLKMYKGISATREYLQKLVENTKDISRDDIELFIIPSYTTLQTATDCCDRDFVRLGAQNMCWEDQGQFTGEISPCMLAEMGLDLVMIGHSERRHVFGESDVEENKKVKAALSHGFKTLGGVGGVVLAIISALSAFLFYFLFQLTLPKNKRNAMGAAIGTTAANATSVPASLAEVDPAWQSAASTATAQLAVAAIVTAFTAPIITSMCDKHMRKKKLGIYSDAAIAEREAKEKQGA